MAPRCPFCSIELIVTNPYNKLVLQTESGKEWSDVATVIEIEDNNNDNIVQSSSIQQSSYLKQYPKYAPQIGITSY